MKYEKIKKYKDEKFRRITGVKRVTFEKMIEILKAAYAKKHKRRGRHSKLTIEDMLLSTLEYLREYRTYAHIAASYDVDESNIYRTIKWVEDTLIKGDCSICVAYCRGCRPRRSANIALHWYWWVAQCVTPTIQTNIF